MSIVWLIGAPGGVVEEFSEALSGFFAVRRIASLLSFARLVAMGELPRESEFMCVAHITSSDELMGLHSAFSGFMRTHTHRQLCVLGQPTDDQRKVLDSFNVACLGLPDDAIQTAKLIRLLMSSGPVRAAGDFDGDLIRVGDLEIDRNAASLRVLATGVEEPLTPKEVRILYVLSACVNQAVSRDELTRKVWQGTHVSTSTVDSHMSRLRKKIEKSFECRLETRYGSGWVLAMRADSP